MSDMLPEGMNGLAGTFRVNEMVYNTIIGKIMNREWLPGMKISSENQLAQELGVSRMSVREAIEKLAAQGILRKKKGEGTFVNRLTSSIQLNSLIPDILLDVSNVLEIHEFRLFFEVGSTQLCAERCSSELIEKLQAAYDTMCRVNCISREYAEADFEFHRLIGLGSGNSLIIRMNEIMMNMLMAQQIKTNEYLGPSGGLAEHKKILEAIRNRDAEVAGLYMKRHIQVTIDRVRQAMPRDAEHAGRAAAPAGTNENGFPAHAITAEETARGGSAASPPDRILSGASIRKRREKKNG